MLVSPAERLSSIPTVDGALMVEVLSQEKINPRLTDLQHITEDTLPSQLLQTNLPRDA